MPEHHECTSRKRQLPRGWWILFAMLIGLVLWVFIIKGLIGLLRMVTG
ncbi:hypothetical protein KUV62_04990 [Salipiger bermudensis]|nr:hypothetical protein [Salipiger bermudensis]MBY6003253.1 hypothetical protein [Salipiger bermudensis]